MKLTYLHLALLCLGIVIGGAIWAAGVATEAFASPAFSSFWWLSKTDAFSLFFFVPSIIAAAAMIGMHLYFNKDKVFR